MNVVSRPRRKWQPTPFIKASFALHAVCAVALGSSPKTWPWVLSAVAGNQALIMAASMWPRSAWIGENIRSLPATSIAQNEVALTFDDGPDPEVTPRVLDILDRRGYRASFYVVGEKALKHPEIVQEIVKRGHAVENHSHRHANGFAFYGSRRLHREIETAQNAITEIAGTPPRFFRAPMGLRTPFLDPVLARLGLHYSTWTRRGFDSVAKDAAPVLQRLMKGLGAGDILLLHDGAMFAARKTKPIVLDVLPKLLAKISEAGLKPVTLRHACRDVIGD